MHIHAHTSFTYPNVFACIVASSSCSAEPDLVGVQVASAWRTVHGM